MKNLFFLFTVITLVVFSACQQEIISTDDGNDGIDIPQQTDRLGFLSVEATSKIRQLIGDNGVDSPEKVNILIENNVAPFSELSSINATILKNSLVFSEEENRYGYNYSSFLAHSNTIQDFINFHVILNGSEVVIENYLNLPFVHTDLALLETYNQSNNIESKREEKPKCTLDKTPRPACPKVPGDCCVEKNNPPID